MAKKAQEATDESKAAKAQKQKEQAERRAALAKKLEAMSDEEKLAKAIELFAAYDQACADLEEREAEFARARVLKSDAVKAIAETLGEGPYNHRGEEKVIHVREETYFFRTVAQKQATVVP